MTIIHYGSIGPHGEIVETDIMHDMNVLQQLIWDLEVFGYTLLFFNNRGVIIEYSDMASPLSDKVRDIEAKTNSLETQLTQQSILLNDLISDPSGPSGEEVTEEFFIFADMLPEYIRKELKIFIKKHERKTNNI